MHFLCSRLVRDVTNLSKRAGIASFAFSGRFSTSKRNGSITTMCQKNFPLFSLPGGQGGVEEQGSPHPRSFCAVMDLVICGFCSPPVHGAFSPPYLPSSLNCLIRDLGSNHRTSRELSCSSHIAVTHCDASPYAPFDFKKRQIPFERLNNLLACIYIYFNYSFFKAATIKFCLK